MPVDLSLYADSAGPRDCRRHGTFYIQWPFPPRITAGQRLAEADVAELRAGYVRRDRQIALDQHLEEQLGRELEQVELCIRNVDGR